jgi:hypothetical protein
MKRQVFFSLCILFAFSTIATAQTVDLLEDGKLDHWVTAAGKSVTTGWSFEDGALKCEGRGSGLLLTKETYRDFALEGSIFKTPSSRYALSCSGNPVVKFSIFK